MFDFVQTPRIFAQLAFAGAQMRGLKLKGGEGQFRRDRTAFCWRSYCSRRKSSL